MESIEGIMTDEAMNQIMEEHFAECSRFNKEANRKNNRILKAIGAIKGKAFVKNLLALFEECEVGSMLGITTEYELSKVSGKSWVNEKYGREIKGYWVDQWAVGDSGDSWNGYIYVQIKPNKFIKAFYSM